MGNTASITSLNDSILLNHGININRVVITTTNPMSSTYAIK